MTRPDYRGSRWPGASSRQKAAKGWGKGKALPCLQGGRAGGLASSVSPLRCGDRGSLTLLTGSPPSPGSQRSTTAKCQPQQTPSPALREGAQHKGSHSTFKVRRLCHEALLPRGPLVLLLQLQPLLLPRRSTLELEAAATPAPTLPRRSTLEPEASVLASSSHGFCQWTTIHSGLGSSSSSREPPPNSPTATSSRHHPQNPPQLPKSRQLRLDSPP